MAVLPLSRAAADDNAGRGKHLDGEEEVTNREVEDELEGLRYGT
jgi:hypothetical protein